MVYPFIGPKKDERAEHISAAMVASWQRRKAAPVSPEVKARARIEKHITQESKSGCWLWVGAVNKRGGYGRSCLEGKAMLAHRLSYLAFNGPFDDSKLICHHCDTPRCVNPAHLFVGTQVDNMADCLKKGRHRPGRRAKATQD